MGVALQVVALRLAMVQHQLATEQQDDDNRLGCRPPDRRRLCFQLSLASYPAPLFYPLFYLMFYFC